MFRHKTFRASCLFVCALVISSSAFADDGKVEVAGFGGINYITSGGGTHAMGGGSLGVRAVEHLRVFGEFTYSQLGSLDASTQDVSASLKDKLYSFGGGVDYGFGSSQRAVPYVLGVLGDGHETYGLSASAGGQSVSQNIETFNHFYAGFGGGVRLFVGEHWGFKPEVRYQRYTSSGWNSVIATVGVFYQFGH